MKLETVLTACNEKEGYLKCIPLFIKVWKRFNVDIKIVMIMNEIPEDYKEYSDHFILFEPIKGMSTAFISQYIRILYPSLIEKEGGVMITDIDMVPISRDFFSTIGGDDNAFIHYYNGQYEIEKMTAMCYNLATPEVWRKINHIKSEDDIKLILRYAYPTNYQVKRGNRAGDTWYRDQHDLHSFINAYSDTKKVKIDNFRRLDRMRKPDPKVRYIDYHFSLHPQNEEYIDLMFPKKYFITYGDEFFKKSRERLRKEVLDMGGFDSVEVFDQDIKEDEEYAKHLSNPIFKETSDARRGGGYWMWKPYLIWKKLQEIEDGDFLVYADAGCSVRRPERLTDMFEFLVKNDYLTVQMRYPEKVWTKKKVLKFFNVEENEDVISKGQFQGGVHAIRKTEKSMKIYKRWWEVCSENPELVNDDKDDEEGYFRDNRHDQSIWSLLIKTEGEYKSCLYPFKETRIKDKPQKIYLTLRHGFFNRLIPLLCVLYYIEGKNAVLYLEWVPEIGRLNIKIEKNEMKRYDIFERIFKKYPKLNFVSNPGVKSCKITDLHNIKNDVKIRHFYNLVDVEKGLNLDNSEKNKYYMNMKNDISAESYIKKLIIFFKNNFEFKYEAENMSKYVGVHFRVTDGMFKRNIESRRNNLENIISENEYVYLSTDSDEVKERYSEVSNVKILNIKNTNNDSGTIESIKEMITLSKCGVLYLTKGSTFGFFSYILSGIEKFHYL